MYNQNNTEISNRKTQENLMTFLNNKKFAGDYQPDIKFETLYYDNGLEIDVIIIRDTPFKPFYLTEDFGKGKKTIRAGVIYNRIIDRNVSINSVANIYQIEKMWKQRFGIDEAPLIRILNLLMKPDEWEKGYKRNKETYHKSFPEFNIEFGSGKYIKHNLSSFFINDEDSILSIAKFKYHNTTLFDLELLDFDHSRLMPIPDIKQFFRRSKFYYFTKNSIKGKFFYFLNDDFTIKDADTTSIPIPIFNDENEMEEFISNLEIDEDLENNVAFRNRQKTNHKTQNGISLELTYQVYEMLKRMS